MIEQINTWLFRVLRVVSGLALVVMMVVAFVDSIGRQLGSPLLGTDEFVRLALMTFFLSSISLVVRDDAQIRVGLMTDSYPDWLKRIETLTTSVIETAAIGLLTWMIFDQSQRLARFETQTLYFKMPMAPWVLLGAIVCGLSLWFAVQNIRHPSNKHRQTSHVSHSEDT